MLFFMGNRQINLTEALASFDTIWSPRIIAQVNDHDIRVAKILGEHLWHTHDETDELFMVLHGDVVVDLRNPDGTERAVELHEGDIFVVPVGTWHRLSSTGASILMFEITGTSSTGDRHDDIPDHVDSTVGHPLTPELQS